MSDAYHTEAQCQIIDEAQEADFWIDAVREDPALLGAVAAWLAECYSLSLPDVVRPAADRVVDESVNARADELAEQARDRHDDYRAEVYRESMRDEG